MYAAPRHNSNKFGFALGLQYILRSGLRIFTHCKSSNLSLITKTINNFLKGNMVNKNSLGKTVTPWDKMKNWAYICRRIPTSQR